MEYFTLTEGIKKIFHTPANEENFFGYYDKSPFNKSGNKLLSHRVNFKGRSPELKDSAEIVIWNLENGQGTTVAKTRAFNWQQGSMLSWLGPDFDRFIIFNDRRREQYVSVIFDSITGKERVLPIAIYNTSPCGRWAVCINYERLFWCRPGYNYAGIGKSKWNSDMPEGDGIYLLDLKNETVETIISTRQMVDFNHLSSMETGANYLEHLLFSPNGERFFFLHRWHTPDGGIFARAFTAKRNGEDIRLLCGSGHISHYNWRDDNTMILTGRLSEGVNWIRKYKFLTQKLLRPVLPLYRKYIASNPNLRNLIISDNYFLVDVLTGKSTYLRKDILNIEGHPSFSPIFNDLFVTDTYEDEQNYRHLYTFDIKREEKYEIGKFFSPPPFNQTGYRCDLHPRWDRQGYKVCIDSLHSGNRQMFVFDLRQIINNFRN